MMQEKQLKLNLLLLRVGLKQDAAIEGKNWETFFYWHKIALRLLQYKINLTYKDLKV